MMQVFPMTMIKWRRREEEHDGVCVSGNIKITGEISLTHNFELYPPQ
jgi:hypothetical protein